MADRKSVSYGTTTWFYGADPNAWVGAASSATTVGAAGANTAMYGGGNSKLVGGGGGGDNTFYVGSTDSVVTGVGDGVDTEVSYWGDLTLAKGVANGTLMGAGTLTGNAGNNILTATGTNAHTIVAGSGSDLLVGANGAADRFVVTKGSGNDAIQNFEHGRDVLQLNGFTAATANTGFAGVAAAMSQQGANVVLTLDAGQTITFANATVAQFTAADFALPFSTANLRLTFGDEFNSFNASASGLGTVWKTGNAPASSDELESYANQDSPTNPFSNVNGVLNITASATGKGNAYVSGNITTAQSFSQTYGYFEMRAQLPAAQGMWPAFWMLPADGTWPPELDVLESVSSDPTHIVTSTHSAVGGPNVATSISVAVSDTTAGYHTYAVDWEPSTLTFYVDGNAVSSMATPADMNKPMYLVANLAVGGSWAGNPSGAPGTLKIDYIHAYATAGTTVVNNLISKPVALSGWGQVVTQGAGNYAVTGSPGGANVTLGDGNDTINLTGGNNSIKLGNGSQSVVMNGNSNNVTLGSGASTVSINGSYSTVTVGGNAPGSTTTLSGNGYVDNFTSTGAGNVSVSGTIGYSTIKLASGNHSVTTGGSNNTITVGAGSSVINAGTSSNVVHAAGSATITVSGWFNLLDAGPGSNVLNGGMGNDTFMLNAAGQGSDTVNGFTLYNSDVLNLSRSVNGLGVASDLSNIGTVLTAKAANGSTSLFITPPGGSASAIAVLTNTTASVADLVAHHSIKIA